ncbi:MAG: hypothetical protein QI197_05430 [Candidatus Korarchaeota archaeon]|nr:hypothetical protein [Candidatus Korarchaeota archaeon]
MRRKLILILASISLIALLTLPVYAQAGKEELARKLIRSYENVKSFLQSIMGNLNDEAASKVEDALARADPLIEEANALLSSGDYGSAVEKAREALSVIRDVLRDIKDVSVIREGGRLRMTIGRLSRAVARVERVIQALENRGVNTTNFTSQLEEVKSLLEDAKSLLKSGDLEGAREKIEEAVNDLRSLYSDVREAAKEHLNLTKERALNRVKRIERASERCIVRLDLIHKKLLRDNKTEDAEKVLKLKNSIERALLSLKRHIENGQRFLALEDVRQLFRYLRVCRRLGT